MNQFHGINRIGKIGKRNLEANRKLKDIFFTKKIFKCEIGLSGCLIDWTLQFCHRHKRNWYYKRPELLSDFNQVILGCQKCHDRMERDKDLTEAIFKRLRDNRLEDDDNEII